MKILRNKYSLGLGVRTLTNMLVNKSHQLAEVQLQMQGLEQH